MQSMKLVHCESCLAANATKDRRCHFCGKSLAPANRPNPRTIGEEMTFNRFHKQIT